MALLMIPATKAFGGVYFGCTVTTPPLMRPRLPTCSADASLQYLALETGLFGKYGASHDFGDVYELNKDGSTHHNGRPTAGQLKHQPAQYTEAHKARLQARGVEICDARAVQAYVRSRGLQQQPH